MKDFHVLALSNDNGVRTYAILAGEKPIGRAIRKNKNIVFQVTGYPPQKAYGSNVERIIAKWLDGHYVDLQEGDVILHPHFKAQQQEKERLDQLIADYQKQAAAEEADLKRLATFWWNNDESPEVEQLLARMGWEIGQDEGYDDEPGAFVVQIGDEDGDSFLSWSPDELRNNVTEGDVVKHKFGLKQQQKNKTKYRFYQEIKDDIPVYDRGTHNAILPKYIESHRHPENLEPFDHFEVQPSVSGVNGRILGITRDGMKVLTSVARLELAKVLADAYNRGGFSDKDIEKVPLDTLESIAESDKEHPGRDAIRKYIQRQHDIRRATGADIANKKILNRTKADRVGFDNLEQRVLQLVGKKTYNSDDPADIERVENIRLALKRKLSKESPHDSKRSKKLSKFEKSVDISNKAYTGYVDEAGYESSWQKRYRTDPEFRERQKQNERNRRKNPEYAEKKREYQRERSRKLYADPDWREEDLARRRDVYAANKDAVLAKRRELMKDPAYAARKAEYWKQDAAKRKELAQRFQQYIQDPNFNPAKLPTEELKKFIKFLEKGRV